jgi:hypothetical protein
MLRSVGPGMLVMWDRGFHDFDMIMRALKQGTQVLSRLPGHVKPRVVRKLPDGSYLAYIYPSEPQRRKKGEHLSVRVGLHYRALAVEHEPDLAWFWIGSHADYDQLLGRG